MKRTALCLSLVVFAVAASCRRSPPRVGGAPTWSFGVPRGASSERVGDGQVPIQLTASDGTGLSLVSLDARVAIEGPLAFTELTMGFQNPVDRTIEGHFDIVLPSGAAVSRFAMKLPEGWQEAEVVEKQAARAAYEDALHRKQDPALLEKAAGNQFSARVFPIAGKAIKEIKLSYSQELPSVDEPYRLPLRGLPLLPALQIVVYAEETLVRVARQQFTADGDFLLERPSAASGLRSKKLVVARLRPPLPVESSSLAAPGAGVVLLLDTSASRAPGFERQVAELGALVEALRRAHGDALPLRVAAFDQEVAPLYAGTTGGFAREAQAILDGVKARGALGASDIAGALTWVGHTVTDGHQRVVLLTDGVATASASVVSDTIADAGNDTVAMARAVDALKPKVDRLDVILVGGIRDDVAMRALAMHHLAADGAVLDAAEGPERLVQRLDMATRSGLRVSVPGAAWVWPATVDGLQRGDDLVVYAEMVDDASRDSVKVRLSSGTGGAGDIDTDVPLGERESPGIAALVERAWAQARIASLGAQAAALPSDKQEQASALHQQIVTLSTRYRVLCDDTALLVLERESDYERFHIDRHALADILVVGDEGVRLQQRRDLVIADHEKKLRELEQQAETLRRTIADEKKEDDKKAKEKDKDDDRDKGGDEVARAAPAAVSPEPAPVEKTLSVDGERRARLQQETSQLAVLKVPESGSSTLDSSSGGHAGAPMGGLSGLGSRGAGGAPHALSLSSPRSPMADAAPAHRYLEAPRPRPQPSMAPPRTSMARPAHHQVSDPADPLSFGDGPSSLSSLIGAAPPEDSGAPAWTGRMLDVMTLVGNHKLDDALASAKKWHAEEPGDVLALVALGNVHRAAGKLSEAARAYGSIIDLFPSRADLRRFAGDLLEGLGPIAAPLAADSFAHAAHDRADHPNSHRLRAYALLRAGHLPEAFAAIESGSAREYPSGRFLGVDRILREDAGLIAAAWLVRDPAKRAGIVERLAKLHATLPTGPSLRFVLSWETDANDVDFHISDKEGNRAWYAQQHLATGGDLYADVTTGYGPECFTIEGKPAHYPYRIRAHYYSRGPMGYGMGKVEIIEHDGHGNLRFEERPFVVMSDQAYVDLGSVEGPLAK